jgi:hypothetical protein
MVMPMGAAAGAVAPGGGPPGTGDAVVLFDLSNPDAPRRAGRVDLPDSAWSWGLRAEGGLLWLTHHEWASADGSEVRFYLDRIDPSDPDAPRLLPKVNVPGVLLGAAAGGSRVYTLETAWDGAGQSATSTLNVLDLTSRGTARLAGSVALPGYAAGAVLGEGFAYAVTQDGSATAPGVRLTSIDLGAVRAAAPQQIEGSWAWPLRVAGGKLFLAAGAAAGPSVLVYGLAAPGSPAFETAAPTQGWAWDVVVEGRVAYLPAGPYGVAMVPLAP